MLIAPQFPSHYHVCLCLHLCLTTVALAIFPFDAAIELGVNEELLDRAMEEAADPKAAIQQLLDDAQSGSGRTGDGKKVGPLSEGFKSRLPRGPVKATHKVDVG